MADATSSGPLIASRTGSGDVKAAMCSNAPRSSRHVMYLGTEVSVALPIGDATINWSRRSGAGYGSGSSSTLMTMLNIAALGPIPIARTRIAVAVDAELRRIVRRA